MLKTRRGVIPKLISQRHSLERNTWHLTTCAEHRGLTPITQGTATWHYHTSTLPYWINPVDTRSNHFANFGDSVLETWMMWCAIQAQQAHSPIL
ncbi:hypothetical protein AHAS_Ahas01G0288000 [Arachis hypogaea]